VLFSALPGDHSAARLARPGVRAEGGAHLLSGPGPLGPFVLARDEFLLGDAPDVRHYAARVVEHRGSPWLLAWRWHDDDGAFLGELGDPMPSRPARTARSPWSAQTPGASDVESPGGPLWRPGPVAGCRACESESSPAGATVPA
jgi:hypothetical protein